jgi:peptidoglycan-associated lipoprotein
MNKKERAMLIIMALICSFFLVTASCTKKTKKKGPSGVSPSTDVKKGETEAERIKRLEREARLRELEEQKRLARKFEAEAIYFDYNESFLTPTARAKVKKKAAWLKSNSAYSVLIEGHCDERGTNAYNLALGDRRANTTRKHFIFLGISEKRIKTVSYGEEKPADPGHSESAWAKNRRCEFKLVK